MKILNILICVFFFISSICFGFEEDLDSQRIDSDDVPQGMEVVQITSGSRILVPKGAKVKKVGAQIIIEGDQEYFSRRFQEVTQEIENLKGSVSVLQNQIEKLNQATEDQKESVNPVIKTKDQNKE